MVHERSSSYSSFLSFFGSIPDTAKKEVQKNLISGVLLSFFLSSSPNRRIGKWKASFFLFFCLRLQKAFVGDMQGIRILFRLGMVRKNGGNLSAPSSSKMLASQRGNSTKTYKRKKREQAKQSNIIFQSYIPKQRVEEESTCLLQQAIYRLDSSFPCSPYRPLRSLGFRHSKGIRKHIRQADHQPIHQRLLECLIWHLKKPINVGSQKTNKLIENNGLRLRFTPIRGKSLSNFSCPRKAGKTVISDFRWAQTETYTLSCV